MALNCWHRFDSQYAAQAGFKPQRYDDGVGQQNFRPRANLSMTNMLATPATVYDQKCYSDSGATHHVTLDPLNLMDKIDDGGIEKVIIGNGSGLQIHHIRNSYFTSGSSSHSFLINKLLHVQHITKNLLSVS